MMKTLKSHIFVGRWIEHWWGRKNA